MRRACAMLAVSLGACGLGLADDTSGGKDHLPAAGAGPFRRPAFDLETPIDEPWLASDSVLDLDEPSALPRAGGGIRYWLGREPAGDPPDDTQIWAGAIADVRAAPDPLVLALAADRPWEQGRVGAPALVADPADDEHLIMFYEGGVGDRAIGRADSTDGGRTWQKRPAPVLDGAGSPGAAWDGETWLLAVERAAAPGIWLARSADGLAFTLDDAPVLAARAGAFDAVAVREPALAWHVTSTGRGVWMMWYAGTDEPPPDDDAPWIFSIGYAASFDGLAWQRLAGTRPILAAPCGAPAVVLGDGGPDYLLYSAVDSLRRAVGIATH